MVVCKYFLQGTCTYGTYCHHDHRVPANYNTRFTVDRPPSTSILHQPNTNFQARPTNKAPSVDLNTLTKSVVHDMLEAEKGGQWLFSCYAPFKEKPPFPGFEDWSPEEVRWGFYEAQTGGGNLEQYKQQLQMLLQEAVGKVRALQNPSAEVLKILQGIYNSSSTGNIFAAEAQNIFSAPSKEINIFAAAAAPTTNIFAQANSVFAPSQPPPNLFPSAQSPQNMFAPAQNTFPTSQPPQNVFQTAQNIFAPSSQPPQNIFVQALPPPPPPSYSSSVFGGSSRNRSDEHLYSKEEELSEKEKSWFLSDSADITSIPKKPPTYEMCFKS